MHITRTPAAFLCLALTTAGCNKDEARTGTAPVALSSASPDAAKNVVTVDPALLASGRIQLGAVERRAPRGEQRVPGEIRSSESGNAEAGTLVSGRVASLEVAEGAHVKKGQILAWVDAPEVGRATAEFLRARSRAAVAGRKLSRQLDLEKQQATSANAVDDARAEDAAARADLLAARTLLAGLGGVEPSVDSERTMAVVRVPVRSPIDGLVEKRDAVVGAPVMPERSLFRIVAGPRGDGGAEARGSSSQSTVAVIARIPESADVPAAGATATLVGRGDAKQTCQGVATGTLGAIDEGTRTTSLRIEPERACTWLVPGGYVDVVFARAAGAGGESLLVVPREAVVDVNGVPCAFVSTGKPGELVARALRVKTGAGPDLVVESGLAEGEKIAIKGALLLKGELLRAELGQ
jgi:cobalt-zinc-cadmium efflux system membrane fusion protein